MIVSAPWAEGGGVMGEGEGEKNTNRLETTRAADVVLYSGSINMSLRRQDQKLHGSHTYAAELISSVLSPAISIRQEHLSLTTMAASRKSASRSGLVPATEFLSPVRRVSGEHTYVSREEGDIHKDGANLRRSIVDLACLFVPGGSGRQGKKRHRTFLAVSLVEMYPNPWLRLPSPRQQSYLSGLVQTAWAASGPYQIRMRLRRSWFAGRRR
ncbi:hypothetical protein BD310DRAFT_299597 [Dichomitus squalens]|uniref:Uncharacterized protein n=1 Tax=Dichomitus squalens TaxID=114155 RepID=A0A4Q9QBM8_9APHY|nr:hypothetical protein BD310DRAFT_299597 [Dichomitus squalens]